MSTLRKFKVLATHCAVSAASPTASPTASPVTHLRRRRSLRKLLRRHHTPPPPAAVSSAGAAASLKLKDFLLSSPPRKVPEEKVGVSRVRVPPQAMPRGGRGLVTATLRQRLMRKSWRPVLGSIPE